jgi:hypothetical protein
MCVKTGLLPIYSHFRLNLLLNAVTVSVHLTETFDREQVVGSIDLDDAARKSKKENEG